LAAYHQPQLVLHTSAGDPVFSDDVAQTACIVVSLSNGAEPKLLAAAKSPSAILSRAERNQSPFRKSSLTATIRSGGVCRKTIVQNYGKKNEFEKKQKTARAHSMLRVRENISERKCC